MSDDVVKDIGIPESFSELFNPAWRYITYYGGRGSAKSHSIARALLLHGLQRKEFIPCVREFQKSIKDSVHRLLSNLIVELDMQYHYTVLNDTIVSPTTGTEFVYGGLHHNIANLKSLEGATKCWVEEGQNVSERSWTVLTPTIRLAGSQIITSFNPDLDTDPTYVRFVTKSPSNAFVKRVNYTENPHFGDPLMTEMLDMQRDDYTEYLTVWGGRPRITVRGAIYEREMQKATVEGRIGRVPYDPSAGGVYTFWDLGWSDLCGIWFCQKVGFEWRMIRYEEDRHTSLEEWAKRFATYGYAYACDYLPHDAGNATLAAAGKTIQQQWTALRPGVPNKVVPRTPTKQTQIMASRGAFPNVWFDQEKCVDGLQALRKYAYKVNVDTGQYSREPDHNEYSHGADAFGTFAESRNVKPSTARETGSARARRENVGRPTVTNGWLGA